MIFPRSLKFGDLGGLGFCSIRRPRQYFTLGVSDSDFLGERLRPKNPVECALLLEPPSWLAPDRNQSTYPTTNNPTPTSAVVTCAVGMNAAKARITIPAKIRLSGLRLILGKRFLFGLRFGVVSENVFNAFSFYVLFIFEYYSTSLVYCNAGNSLCLYRL